MPLLQFHLQHSYRTGRGDMVQGFVVPSLEQARRGPHAPPRADSCAPAGIPRRSPGAPHNGLPHPLAQPQHRPRASFLKPE